MIRFQDITIDRKKRTIERNGVTVQFSPLFFRLICALLLGAPMSKSALFDIIYDDRDDGGPLSGTDIIDVMMCQMKPRLVSLGLEICACGPAYSHQRRYWAASVSLLEAAE